MSQQQPTIQRVAIIGAGVIGASWAAYFLARGMHVSASDPAPDAEAELRRLVQSFWPALQQQGLAPGASLENLRFASSIADAVADADFIQENGPERLDIKHDIVAQIEAATRDHVIIASSSSGLLMSDMQQGAKHPERIVLGHPFNPPHLIPLVEVVAGKQTSAETVARTMAFYTAIGKKPIHIRAEVKGHVANRLQAALWKEACYLVDQGVVSVADLDVAISHGPGLRWALLGPFLNLHFSGGVGGIGHTLEHLGPPIEDWWADLGHVPLNEATRKKIEQGVKEELSSYDDADLKAKRDQLLITLLEAKKAVGKLP
ncbi:3-hydroxyacyl-CoA dehydrogenase NAD-binding domain-containing protein [Pusillimonas sp. ANT_WB101]|uniref:3-hydroxyacyl-CoA dehydrogenase NAD-binding domain-containing protein n=1 Tax=Pusillimonas sp. ANT_WB101 TaxID=2597356 RepID=UPI0011EE4AFE|nr:3-hydroxyacyl-CoA dehydrogenase NAD-binding domain-containing protein [Pusillimonas sp. ANT_WB101]KAA0892982.1 3-hydroxyacyl-CoA dehydrogenase [Pusillimonas sp. ANT_WB101]